MRYGLIVVAALCFGFVASSFVRADEEKKEEGKIKGVLVDNMCAKKMEKKDDPQAAAMEHKKDCCMKCKDSGFAVMSDKKLYKFDDEGNKKAIEYLENDKNHTNVVVEGEVKDDMITVKSIHSAKEHDGEKKEG